MASFGDLLPHGRIMTNGGEPLQTAHCPVVDAAGRRVDFPGGTRPAARRQPIGHRAQARSGLVSAARLDGAEHVGSGFSCFPAISGRFPLAPAPWVACILHPGRAPDDGAAGEGKEQIMSTMAFDEGLGPLLSRKEAARYLSERGLQTAPQTLARKFCEGTGPLCATLNRRAMYYRQHLDDWFAEQLAPPRRSATRHDL
jgi:hypothetical protein